MNNIKLTLEMLRTNYGLSQKQAGKLVGVTEDTWRRWEQGKTFPNVPKLQRIEQVFGVSYNDISFLTDVTV